MPLKKYLITYKILRTFTLRHFYCTLITSDDKRLHEHDEIKQFLPLCESI